MKASKNRMDQKRKYEQEWIEFLRKEAGVTRKDLQPKKKDEEVKQGSAKEKK